MTKENKTGPTRRKYRVSLVEEQTQRLVWQRRFTRPLLWLSVISAAVIGAGLVWCLVAFTPLRMTIPGYPTARTRNLAVQNAIKIDSLENLISRWDLYAENLRRVVAGQEPLQIDSVLRVRAVLDSLPADASALARQDSLLRQSVAGSVQEGKSRRPVLEGLHFIAPLKGVVSRGYEPGVHPYVDVSAPEGTVVVSVLDGTVIYAGWNEEMGYTIGVQHPSGVVTFYKHNQKLLKSIGDKVTAGTSIALVGNTGSAGAASVDHLHFELWFDGEPVDPTQYINF